MKVLVANLGSTSFKYRLFDMSNERQMARGGVERIGASESHCVVEIGEQRKNHVTHVPDHAEAVRQCMAQLTDPDHGCLAAASEVSAIGFKAIVAHNISGVQRVTDEVLEAMQEMAQIAPAHNPAYITAMRLLSDRLPDIPLVAAFETGFHSTVPERQRCYAIPYVWSEEMGLKKWGYHGASHRYIAGRTAELIGRNDARVISCHLGGSSSLCAIRNGESRATSWGMSAQSGLPHNNRVGDFDAHALPLIMKQTGNSLDEILNILASESGLLGMSGISGDLRDLEQSAAVGDRRAQLAVDVYVTEIRRHLGGLLVELGGVDAIVFTGGIGENGVNVRASVCANLQQLGIALDEQKNQVASGECEIGAANSPAKIWVVPTNEELIVARQTYQLLQD